VVSKLGVEIMKHCSKHKLWYLIKCPVCKREKRVDKLVQQETKDAGRCPNCDSVLKRIGRCGFCQNTDCTLDHVQFRKEYSDCLICTIDKPITQETKDGERRYR